MKDEDSASVCCSCDAVRISVEKGVPAAVAAVASKGGLRGSGGSGRPYGHGHAGRADTGGRTGTVKTRERMAVPIS
ncbi:hypothetical protein GCM10010327_15210 [Streptomyces nitrosporeus]|nr:hypothetical protein GCM10010327_15210 [Streptomyces nitrosporeus]